MSKRAEKAAENIGYIGISYKAVKIFKEGVKAGYEQAEKDTIERAIQWLIAHADDYIYKRSKLHVGGMCWEDLKKQWRNSYE